MDTFTLDDVIAKAKEFARENAKSELRQIRQKAATGCTIGPTYYSMTPEFDLESVERYCVAAENQAVQDLFFRLVYGREADATGTVIRTWAFDAGPEREA